MVFISLLNWNKRVCLKNMYYQTEGVIFESFDAGEDNRNLLIFSREFGLIRAYSKSSRKIHSKLRPLLQKFTYADISLVSGKNSLRVTGAEEFFNTYYKLFGAVNASSGGDINKYKSQALFRVYVLLLRLLQGQESDRILYDILKSFTDKLIKGYNDKTLIKVFELLAVSRILSRLGYMEDVYIDEESNLFFAADCKALEFVKRNYSFILGKVNAAIESSHL